MRLARQIGVAQAAVPIAPAAARHTGDHRLAQVLMIGQALHMVVAVPMQTADKLAVDTPVPELRRYGCGDYGATD